MPNKKSKKQSRNLYFCLGRSTCFKRPIHLVLKQLLKKHDLNWVRLRISYHNFGNVGTSIISDTIRKVDKNLVAAEFMQESCNCSGDQGCLYGNVCRDRCLVYKVEDVDTGQYYIGNTIQPLKKRMQQHFYDCQSLFKNDSSKKRSDTFSRFFASKFKLKPSVQQLRARMKFSVIWKARGINFMKNFGRVTCEICCRVKIEIVQASLHDKKKVINSSMDIYATCRHYKSAKFLTLKNLLLSDWFLSLYWWSKLVKKIFIFILDL